MSLRELAPWRGNRGVTTRETVDPFRVFQREIDRLFSDFFQGWGGPDEGQAGQSMLMPSLDVRQSDKAYDISVELPGVDPQDVDVSIDNGVLTIRGEKKMEEEHKDNNQIRVERNYGSFARALTLPDDANPDGCEASFKDGVLRITLPRREEAHKQRRKIEIRNQ